MDHLDDDESFLDALMSLRGEPAPGSARAPWQPYPSPVGGMMASDLLFYVGGERANEETARIHNVPSSFGDLLAPVPAPPHPHPLAHDDFNFDCLSEVCNPYRTFVPGPGVVDDAAAGQALPRPHLHDAMVEDETSGDKLHHGAAGFSSSPTTMFMFGEGEGAGEMTRARPADAHPRSNKQLHGGAPSKNLMAERRRRKRLNDRLAMLRSIVPKISKMDRTSILGDTIDYVKELTERIKTLEEEVGATPEELNLLNTTMNFSGGSNDEMPMRNSTKFVVEKRGDGGARIEICCAANPGVLLSTVSGMEVLGLEIEQCVLSCFGDFGMQASCSQEEGKSQVISVDHIKQALFRSAGYGGTCL